MSGVDPSLGVNSFNQAKYKNETETVAKSILNLLFGKPGYFPSMPDLGIDIKNTVYMFWDDIDTDVIKAMIISQCQEFEEFVDDGSLDVIKSSYGGEPLLLVVIPVQIQDQIQTLGIGIVQNENGELKYNYIFE